MAQLAVAKRRWTGSRADSFTGLKFKDESESPFGSSLCNIEWQLFYAEDGAHILISCLKTHQSTARWRRRSLGTERSSGGLIQKHEEKDGVIHSAKSYEARPRLCTISSQDCARWRRM